MVFPDPHLDSVDLRGVAVLAVEDDYFIADEIRGALHAVRKATAPIASLRLRQ